MQWLWSTGNGNDGGDGGVNGNDIDSNSHDDVGCVSPPLPHNHFDVLLGLLQLNKVIIMVLRTQTIRKL